MIVIKDSMVLVHLAKLSLLEKSCDNFGKVIIPYLVYEEVIKGKEKIFSDTVIINDLIKRNKIVIQKLKNKDLIQKANEFNIQRGEAEVVALYWQEKADFIATDDDNVRKKRIILNIKVIGTPAIVLALCKNKVIDKKKVIESIGELKEIGWFSNIVLDKILIEVENE